MQTKSQNPIEALIQKTAQDLASLLTRQELEPEEEGVRLRFNIDRVEGDWIADLLARYGLTRDGLDHGVADKTAWFDDQIKALDRKYGEHRTSVDSMLKLKHHGPGTHPGTGTEQDVHAGGRARKVQRDPESGRLKVSFGSKEDRSRFSADLAQVVAEVYRVTDKDAKLDKLLNNTVWEAIVYQIGLDDKTIDEKWLQDIDIAEPNDAQTRVLEETYLFGNILNQEMKRIGFDESRLDDDAAFALDELREITELYDPDPHIEERMSIYDEEIQDVVRDYMSGSPGDRTDEFERFMIFNYVNNRGFLGNRPVVTQEFAQENMAVGENNTIEGPGILPEYVASIMQKATAEGRMTERVGQLIADKFAERARTEGTLEHSMALDAADKGGTESWIFSNYDNMQPYQWIPPDEGKEIQNTAQLLNDDWSTTTQSLGGIALSEAVADLYGGDPIPRENNHLISGAGIEFPQHISEYLDLAPDDPDHFLDSELAVQFLELDEVQTESREWVRTMYERTQAYMSEFGLKPGDTIRLYRGMGTLTNDEWNPNGDEGPAQVDMWAVSSWSTDIETARGFSNDEDEAADGAIVVADVPIERILSTPTTGFGCKRETEFIVLGQDGIKGTVYNAEIRPDYQVESLIDIWSTEAEKLGIEEDVYEANKDLYQGSVERGGPGSGHHAHEGRPGEVGGSQPSGVSAPFSDPDLKAKLLGLYKGLGEVGKVRRSKKAQEYFEVATHWFLNRKVSMSLEEIDSVSHARGFRLRDENGNVLTVQIGELNWGNREELILSWIDANNKGTGFGSAFMRACKSYADGKKIPFRIVQVTNPAFYRRFDWLTDLTPGEDYGNNEFLYETKKMVNRFESEPSDDTFDWTEPPHDPAGKQWPPIIPVERHYGPGPHPGTGTEQTAHAGNGSGDLPRSMSLTPGERERLADAGIMLHASSSKFDRFEIEATPHGAIYFSDPGIRSDSKTQAEHIAGGPFGGRLIFAELDRERFKKFDPGNDPASLKIFKRLFPDAKGTQGYNSTHFTDLIDYVHVPQIVQDREYQESGFNMLRVYEPAVQGESLAITDDSLVKILGDADLIERHYGPGSHPGTGTPQTEHAGGRGRKSVREGGKPYGGKVSEDIYIGVKADPERWPPGTKIGTVFDEDFRQPSGAPIRGQAIIALDDERIPDYVYHMTTNLEGILDSGEISARGVGGLGGDKLDEIVSMTTSEEIAKSLAADTRMVVQISQEYADKWYQTVWPDNFPEEPKYFVDRLTGERMNEERRREITTSFLDRMNEIDTQTGDWKFEWDLDYIDPSYIINDWWRQYFMSRERHAGVKNPLFFTDPEILAQKDPAKVGVVKIPKQNLDTGALMTDFDLDNKYGLKEVRIYGDVPLADVEVIDGQVGETVERHHGPGAHPGTGTEQEVHAGEGARVAEAEAPYAVKPTAQQAAEGKYPFREPGTGTEQTAHAGGRGGRRVREGGDPYAERVSLTDKRHWEPIVKGFQSAYESREIDPWDLRSKEGMTSFWLTPDGKLFAFGGQNTHNMTAAGALGDAAEADAWSTEVKEAYQRLKNSYATDTPGLDLIMEMGFIRGIYVKGRNKEIVFTMEESAPPRGAQKRIIEDIFSFSPERDYKTNWAVFAGDKHVKGGHDRDSFRAYFGMVERVGPLRRIFQVLRGGPGSGHHGHAGRPGEVGGSLPSGKSVREGDKPYGSVYHNWGDLLKVPKTDRWQPVRDAFDLIAQVHTIPQDKGIVPIPIKSSKGLQRVGFYRYFDKGFGEFEPKDLFVQLNDFWATSSITTMVHELGHYLDQQGFFQGKFASSMATYNYAVGLEPGVYDAWKNWQEAAEGSQHYQDLRDYQTGIKSIEVPEGYYMGYPGSPDYEAPPAGTEARMQYKFELKRSRLSIEELFARSYVQWIGEKTGDPTIRRDIDNQAIFTAQGGMPRYWTDEDFKPVSEAMDEIFRSSGWLIE